MRIAIGGSPVDWRPLPHNSASNSARRSDHRSATGSVYGKEAASHRELASRLNDRIVKGGGVDDEAEDGHEDDAGAAEAEGEADDAVEESAAAPKSELMGRWSNRVAIASSTSEWDGEAMDAAG